MAERTIYVSFYELGLSEKTLHYLRSRNVISLNDLEKQRDLILSDDSIKSITVRRELEETIENLDDIFARFERRKCLIDSLDEEICALPVEKLYLSTRAVNALKRSRINTVGEMVKLTNVTVDGIRNVGRLTKNEILLMIDRILNEGKSFLERIPGEVEEEKEDLQPVIRAQEKGFDYQTIDILTKEFFMKPVRMTEWFGLSRQGVYNILEARSRKKADNWTGKELTSEEEIILSELLESGKFELKKDIVTCCCFNNRKDDFICLFIYNNEIKCFFLKDFSEDIKQTIIEKNYHRFSESELAGESSGSVAYVVKKPYFIPQYPDKFRSNAQARGLSADEYALFLYEMPVGDSRMTTDDRVIAFLESNKKDGKVYISSDPENQWFRSFASRNGYSISDFISLYGYEQLLNGPERTTDGARERHVKELSQYIVHDNVVYIPSYSHIYRVLRTYTSNKGISFDAYLEELGFKSTRERPNLLDTLESDMQVYSGNGKYIDDTFACNPLIGSRILDQKTQETLNTNAEKYIEFLLKNPQTRLSLQAEMQITLALINYAKDWNNEENSNFWSYICLRFGYRDTNGNVVRILQNALESALKKNKRLFVEDSNGRAFKSTVVVHALSTRKSWMALFDFLFDFYKNNLNWKLIPGDPLLSIMVQSLQKRLSGEGDDIVLSFSSQFYSFQEGIRKLILLRPVFTQRLFERLIKRIDALINSEILPADTYEAQLCEEWFQNKLISIAGTKKTERQSQNLQREVAIDYTRIRPKFILKNENQIQLVLPDIRLMQEEVEKAELHVLIDGNISISRKLSWYGNELGKTLNGVSFVLPSLPGENDSLDIQVRIFCDDEEIYDSESSLNRRAFVFHGINEINSGSMTKGNYTLVIPESAVLHAEEARITEIEPFSNPGLKAVFLELEDGYVITVNGRLLSFDNENGKDVRVIVPSETTTLPRVTKDEEEYELAYYSSYFSVIFSKSDYQRQFVVMRNGEKVEFADLIPYDNQHSLIVPVKEKENCFHLQILDLQDEKTIFDKNYYLVGQAECNFNREFYYSGSDYEDAEYRVHIDGEDEAITFTQEEEEIFLPFEGGVLHERIPRIYIEENGGNWLGQETPVEYIDNIPQTSVLKVTNPQGTAVHFYIDENEIICNENGFAAIGNALQSYRNSQTVTDVKVVMRVSGKTQSENYLIARIFYKETFLNPPEFWTEGNRLVWNRGGAFIGKNGRSFTLNLYGEDDECLEYKLSEETEYLELPEGMPAGIYRYAVSILTGSLFKKEKVILAEGNCIIGDRNLLRFRNCRIVLDAITDEFNEEEGHIRIRPCCIDQISFQGIEDTTEGFCPLYRGIMYTTGYHGERFEFSSYDHTNDRGITKMAVNPVRIVYINDTLLSITDPDGGGLYYYRYFDRDSRETRFALTDRMYTEKTRRNYSNPDLYLYRIERI